MATLDLGQVVGKSAYEYAVDGGYTGTEEEFQALMANTASKVYVDGLFNQVAPVIVTVEAEDAEGSPARESYNVKCYPVTTGYASGVGETVSYSINFGFPPGFGLKRYITISPPAQYAFTGLYSSSGVVLEYKGYDSMPSNYGVIHPDGTIFFGIYVDADTQVYDVVLTGTFTLEVA